MSKLVPNKKRERGANYTPEEKTMLAELIMQYKHIIEDKRTGGIYIGKKKDAWILVTNKYNSSCTSGLREMEQLKALYDNMKQKARKNIGESNKLEYIENLKLCTQSDNDLITEEDVARALRNVKEDKKQINKTGGGLYKPQATDSDAKILSIIQDQVEPLHNPFDSAANFFKDDMEIGQEIDVECESNEIPLQQHIFTTATTADNLTTVDVADKENNNKEANITTPVPIRKMKPKKLMQQKVKRNMSAEALKRLYFKKKCELANLERKNVMLDILHKKKEHGLKMVLLKKKIECLSK